MAWYADESYEQETNFLLEYEFFKYLPALWWGILSALFLGPPVVWT